MVTQSVQDRTETFEQGLETPGISPATKASHVPADVSQLRSKSFWLEGVLENYSPNPPLVGDREYDFVIVGGGFTGTSTAYFLKERNPSLKIAVLESHVVGYGASGRNDGFNMTLLGENIIALAHIAGEKKAKAAHEWAIEAVDTVRRMVEKHNIDCDYEHSGFLQIGVSKPHVAKIKKEVELHKKFGTDAKFLTEDQVRELLPSTRALAGMLDPHCGIMNPAKYVIGMKGVLEKMGVEFFENSPVTEVREGEKIRVITPGGSITAPHAMLATNAYSNKLGYFKSKIFPMFTYIVMTEPLSDRQMSEIGWGGRWGIETTKHFVHYMRLTADNRITLGGGDAFYYYNRGIDHDVRPSTFTQLEEDLTDLFPPLKGIKFTHKWGGPVAVTFDFIPTCGMTGKHQNIYYSTGYTGHGVSLANASGKIIRDLYFHEDTHRTKLFFINRSTIPVPPEPVLYPAVYSYKELLKFMDRIDDRRQ